MRVHGRDQVQQARDYDELCPVIGRYHLHRRLSQSQAVANGRANMVDVVTAVAETETTVQTLVSVRDKVISAYEDILKMPI